MRLIATLFTVMLSLTSWAGELKIEYINSDKYLDIDSGRDMQSRYTERLMKTFNETFTDIAEQLPKGHIMRVAVTQIDLAGDTRFSTGDMYDIRIMKDLYRPLMEFDVTLTDGEQIIYESNERIVDNNYLRRSPMIGHEQFGYEIAMIERWGKKWLKSL